MDLRRVRVRPRVTDGTTARRDMPPGPTSFSPGWLTIPTFWQPFFTVDQRVVLLLRADSGRQWQTVIDVAVRLRLWLWLIWSCGVWSWFVDTDVQIHTAKEKPLAHTTGSW